MIHDVLGEEPTLFRPPYVESNRAVEEATGACGFEWTVQASVRTTDREEESPEKITAEILEHDDFGAGAIIGVDDGRPPPDPLRRDGGGRADRRQRSVRSG